MDSLSLLHLLLFSPGVPGLEIRAAHFDHGMRAESREEALWVRGLCRAWEVPLTLGRASKALGSEEVAREARYEFLLDTFRSQEARWLLTAHHGDDQAETVLFRVVRGTGLRGLAGIPMERAPGILRPLLPFTRKQIETYARGTGLAPRSDPTNLDRRLARNLLRHEILPRLEAGPAPKAREALRRLARLARENEEAWGSLLPSLLEGVQGGDDEGRYVARTSLLSYHPAVQGRVLREWLRRRGIDLDEAGTRAILEFTSTGVSGRSYPLPGHMRLVREFDRLALKAEEADPEEEPLTVTGDQEGAGKVVVRGRTYEVAWGHAAPKAELVESFAFDSLRFPLLIRGWSPGDRIRLPYGTKKLKKVFAEARIPVGERSDVPVVVDASGRVLWACGVARSILSMPGSDADPFFLGLRNAC
jgi:tRNA(Ile)-lysidine synthase